MPTIPRESREYLFVTVRRDTVVVTAGVRLAITAEDARPTEWTDADVISDATAILVAGLTPGRYRVWAEVSIGSERIVEPAGSLVVT